MRTKRVRAHLAVTVGYCPTCRHYGSDCCGTAPTSSLSEIAAVLSGQEWNAETCDRVAAILRQAGYQIVDAAGEG